MRTGSNDKGGGQTGSPVRVQGIEVYPLDTYWRMGYTAIRKLGYPILTNETFLRLLIAIDVEYNSSGYRIVTGKATCKAMLSAVPLSMLTNKHDK